MRVRPLHASKKKPTEWDGVIVKIVQPSQDDHGYIAVWLENKVGYGDDNCEDYAYCSEKQLDTLLVQLKAEKHDVGISLN